MYPNTFTSTNLHLQIHLCVCKAVVVVSPHRPHAERGAGAGEAVSGGEASGSGGAASDVRAGASVPAAAALSGEGVTAPALQQRPSALPHTLHTQQTAAVDGGEVRTQSRHFNSDPMSMHRSKEGT